MRRFWLIPLLALLLAACGSEPDNPEARLRAAITIAEEAVELGAFKDAATIIAPDYLDARGNDPRAIRQLLFAYLQRHRNIHLLTRIAELQLAADAKSADVRLFVAMAGSPIRTMKDAAGLHADLYRFELQFSDGDDGWRLQRADWHRAGLDELLP